MNEVDAKPFITPKRVSGEYEGHRYTLVFDVHAEPDRRWFWVVHFTKVYDIPGAAPTLQQATNAARRSIREMKKRVGP